VAELVGRVWTLEVLISMFGGLALPCPLVLAPAFRLKRICRVLKDVSRPIGFLLVMNVNLLFNIFTA